jgi:serine/threonine-protein kinase
VSTNETRKSQNSNGRLKPRQTLGKYKITGFIGHGGFAQVYSAMDTIEGTAVALKVPLGEFVDQEMLDQFKQEVRLVARLDHPNILPIKNADFINGRFVVVSKLGDETLETRITRRISVEKCLSYFEQMIGAVACAHESNVVHCDIKPENFILFGSDTIMLADFGIAKVSRLTIEGSGTGTVGHMAPEQAMGRPNKRSDVFSLGLIMFRMLSGSWPTYPFDWPPPGAANLRKKFVHPDLIRFIRKAISARPSERFSDAIQMQSVYEKVYETALRNLKRKRRR